MLSKKDKEIKISTLLGKETEVNGDFSAQSSARIDGRVNGNVTVSGSLVLGSGAFIAGDISATAVLIGGEVQGNIVAPEKAELTATAKVFGDIATKVIVIDEHAIFQGRCDMNQTTPTKKSKTTQAAAVRAGKKSAKAALAEALREVAEAQRMEEDGSASHEASVNAAVETVSTEQSEE